MLHLQTIETAADERGEKLFGSCWRFLKDKNSQFFGGEPSDDRYMGKRETPDVITRIMIVLNNIRSFFFYFCEVQAVKTTTENSQRAAIVLIFYPFFLIVFISGPIDRVYSLQR